MHAIQIQSHGGPEQLKAQSVPDPVPVSGEVLVRIKAAAVNPLDAVIRQGQFALARKPPLILGEEGTGVVERAAEGLNEGDRVLVYGGGLGILRDGTWAELIVVPTACVRKIPDDVSFEEGAAVAHVGVAAYGALRLADLQAGDTLVVLGASGGVGSAGVQIGKALGARVVAVVTSGEKAEKVRALGADEVLTFRANLAQQLQNLTNGKGANVVLDPIGAEMTGRALAALGSFGRLVHLGHSAGMTVTINSLDLTAKATRILGFSLFLVPPERAAQDLNDVMTLVHEKKYRAVLDKIYPMDDVVTATEHLGGRVGVGKVVLKIA